MNDKVSFFSKLINLWALCIVLHGLFIIGCDSNKSADMVDPIKAPAKASSMTNLGLHLGSLDPVQQK